MKHTVLLREEKIQDASEGAVISRESDYYTVFG